MIFVLSCGVFSNYVEHRNFIDVCSVMHLPHLRQYAKPMQSITSSFEFKHFKVTGMFHFLIKVMKFGTNVNVFSLREI